jgi:hypothetical protein
VFSFDQGEMLLAFGPDLCMGGEPIVVRIVFEALESNPSYIFAHPDTLNATRAYRMQLGVVVRAFCL